MPYNGLVKDLPYWLQFTVPTYSHPDDKSTTRLPEGSPVLILQGAIPKDPRIPTFLVEICGTPMLFVEIWTGQPNPRSEEHTSELQSRSDLVCRLLLEKKKKQ